MLLLFKPWSQFYGILPDANLNKIAKSIRGIILQSNLFGRTKDLCNGLHSSKAASQSDFDLIIGVVYKKDAPSVVSNVYNKLRKLVSLVSRYQTKSFELMLS